jgi:hypothetical protein
VLLALATRTATCSSVSLTGVLVEWEMDDLFRLCLGAAIGRPAERREGLRSRE